MLGSEELQQFVGTDGHDDAGHEAEELVELSTLHFTTVHTEREHAGADGAGAHDQHDVVERNARDHVEGDAAEAEDDSQHDAELHAVSTVQLGVGAYCSLGGVHGGLRFSRGFPFLMLDHAHICNTRTVQHQRINSFSMCVSHLKWLTYLL